MARCAMDAARRWCGVRDSAGKLLLARALCAYDLSHDVGELLYAGGVGAPDLFVVDTLTYSRYAIE